MSPWEQRFGGLLSRLRLDSIRAKLTALVLVAVLVPTLTTAGASYVLNTRSLTLKANEELRSVGSHTARELDLWVRQAFYEIGVFSSSFEVTENLEVLSSRGPRRAEAAARLRDYVTAVQEKIPDYKDIRVLDANGEIVAAIDEVGRRPAEIPQDWFAALRVDRTQMGEPAWDAAHEAVLATMAEPIQSATTASYLGALVAELDFRQVTDLLSDYAPGESGKAYLVSADGRVITGSERASDPGTRLDPLSLQALRTGPDEAVRYDDLQRTAVLGTLHPVAGGDWVVIAELDQAEAYAPVRSMRNLMVALVSGLLILIGAVAYMLSLFIVRPLDRLAGAAAEVASGDLSVDLPTRGRGEVAELTAAFNHMVQRIREAREELEKRSTTDGLTGLNNRRRGMEALDQAFERSTDTETDMGLLLLDVDNFKRYNDSYGHLEGDEVLRGVAQVIMDATRGKDTSCRYGGEEFMVVLPECDAEGLLETAGRIRSRLALERFAGGAVTVSIGAAIHPTNAKDAHGLIQAADQALYQAKNAGRDRVVLAAEQFEAAPGASDTTSGADREVRSAIPVGV